LPTFVRRWETYLRDAKRDKDPVFMPWHMFAELAEESFTLQAPAVCEAILRAGPWDIHPRVAAMFESPPANFIEVIDRYAQLLTLVASEAETEVEEQQESSKQSTREPAALQLREVMFGPKSPCSVPDEGIVHTETYFDTNTCTALWKLQGEVDRWLIGPELPQGDAEQPQGHADWPPGYALILEDRPTPCTPRIFLRGNILTQGDEVPRRFLQILSLTDRKPFANGSGRLELAESITDHNNPLTARVIVNRVWTQHFGSGLVTTPSDFGLRSQPPSHPKLLDWLTSWFIDHGWSLKELHKLVVTSAAFRRSSLGPADTAELARALQVDPDNRLLWRMNPRRLTFEQFRDSMLASTGELKLQTGGKPADLFDVSNSRRTLYGLVDRQFFPAVLRVFDSANPDLHVAKRNQTIVPQQALFFLNHPLVLQRARQLSAVCSDEADMNRAVVRMFGRVLQREPTEDELQDALQILGQSSGEAPTLRLTAADWTYGYGEYQDARQQVESFHQLPHFTGQSWQGGVKWPDNKLGWVQLTATGGHPGNTRATACVRRWTAPRDMTVRVDSNLRHEVAAGDGVRAFVVGSRAGLLASAKVHQSSATLNVDTIQVSRGDTIEFIVDIDRILNSDQFLWKATITELESQSATVWDSEADFPIDYVEKLGPLDQLAQILFCSNEFLFVD
ncbi:MAG: DUF1553 domain-containing protein, partial [Planctomycetales bacterium]|nr:DUF1553 domain-containing protein [Planctomycetales bacterium]